MNRQWLFPAVALGLISLALGWLFSVRLGGGSVYPEYSSLRADALGTRALYEALEQLPGFAVERDYRPLARLGPQRRVVFITGVPWRSLRSMPQDDLAALNSALQNGARVVVATRPYQVADQEWHDRIEQERERAEKRDGEKKAEESGADPADKKDAQAKPDEPKTKRRSPRKAAEKPRLSVEKAWGVTTLARASFPADAPATLAVGVMDDLPGELGWHSDVAFDLGDVAAWRPLYVRGGKVVMAEKAVGGGSLVLLGDAFPLSNEAMHRQRTTALLAWLLRGHQRAVFVESHLGVVEDKGVGTLARRYGLGGALALAALLAGLYAWRRMVPFYPLRDDHERDGVVTLGHEPTAGLVALLRRSLPRRSVLAACVAEWRKQPAASGSAAARERFETAWRENNSPQAPVETYNQLARALKRR